MILEELGIKNLFTQNSDLRKGGIWGWSLPAHIVTLTNGKTFNVCPNAGQCARFCYAKNGTYNFRGVKAAHLAKLELVLNHREQWKEEVNKELLKKKYINKYIRIHDGGDYFSIDYLLDWVEIAKLNPQCLFYSYTKEVKMFKDCVHLFPDNFLYIYSYGGKQDHLIDPSVDRHSDVFTSLQELQDKGYFLMGEDDKLCVTSPNHKIGLVANNISHFKKKQGDKSFSAWQRGERPDKK